MVEFENAGRYSQEDAPEIIIPLIQQFIQMTEWSRSRLPAPWSEERLTLRHWF
jgi:hypothetical protein